MLSLAKSYYEQKGQQAPDWDESVRFLQTLNKPSAHDLLTSARHQGRTLIQPRCGVGDHEEMKQLHRILHTRSQPDLLTLTIDAHTRLLRLDKVDDVLAASPSHLNGYPLINHGWQKGRDLNLATQAPIEVRHGSPDGRLLFEVAIASGLTSFEGGGIGYNIPYCRDVPLLDSLRYWEETDALAGELKQSGITVDREFFGTLTAVLMPPSIGIAIAILEAISAYRQGVRCLSMAICQTGVPVQDVAALRALRVLAGYFLPEDANFFVVLHEFMGVFPQQRVNADALILMGGLVARAGSVDKIINKTYEESLGVPTPYANADGIHTVRMAFNECYSFLQLDEARVSEEQHQIETEVIDLVGDIVAANDIGLAIAKAFDEGLLDVPFSASRSAKSEVVPIRDEDGFVRFYKSGQLPFSSSASRYNKKQLAKTSDKNAMSYQSILQSILKYAQ